MTKLNNKYTNDLKSNGLLPVNNKINNMRCMKTKDNVVEILNKLLEMGKKGSFILLEQFDPTLLVLPYLLYSLKYFCGNVESKECSHSATPRSIVFTSHTSVRILTCAMEGVEVIAATALCLHNLNNYISALKNRKMLKIFFFLWFP